MLKQSILFEFKADDEKIQGNVVYVQYNIVRLGTLCRLHTAHDWLLFLKTIPVYLYEKATVVYSFI